MVGGTTYILYMLDIGTQQIDGEYLISQAPSSTVPYLLDELQKDACILSPVKARGRFTPLRAIQSISCSQRSQDHQVEE